MFRLARPMMIDSFRAMVHELSSRVNSGDDRICVMIAIACVMQDGDVLDVMNATGLSVAKLAIDLVKSCLLGIDGPPKWSIKYVNQAITKGLIPEIRR